MGPGYDPKRMGIEFVWKSDAERIDFENVVEELMMTTLGETIYKQISERGRSGA